VSKLRFRISMSLDGFVAGPDQSVDNPLGVGGTRLHEWAYPLAVFQKMFGKTGGVIDASNTLIEESQQNLGATVMGRNMFGGGPGPWKTAEPWKGWWGPSPPYHHPVFVITHHAREPLVMEGGTTFHFVTDGPEAALAQARRAAGDRDVSLGGGASAARQLFNAGHIDEMMLSVAPILLGRGERLFEGTGDDLHGLALVRTVSTATVTHLLFARR
jgi:dihydrofolate reductase